MSTDDNLFPKHWGLQDVDSGLQGNDFPDMPDFPDPMAESDAAVNYLSPFIRDFEFTNIVSWEIAGNYFYNLPQQPIGKKIEWVKEPECKTEIEPQILWIYRERSGEKGYQAGKDELLYTIKIFISTNNAKLKKLYEFMQNGVADDEILFFMEDNTGDLSDQSLYVRFGKKVDKDFLLQMSDKNLDFIAQNMPDFDRNKLRELISTGEVKAPITPLRGLLFMALNISTITGAAGKALGWLSEQLGEAVEHLMIPESIWDTKSEDYFLKQENVTDAMQLDTSFFKQWRQSMEQSPQWQVLSAVSPVAERMPQILEVVQNMADWYNAEVAAVVNLIYRRYEQGVEQLDEVLYLSEQIAFLCGLWNGLVDFVAGIFKFLGALLQAQYDIAQNFQAVLEAIDDFREAWAAFSFADFFETAWQLQQDMLVELLVFLKTPNPRDSYNFDRMAYAGGFGVGFIASFFIPLANVSKVSAIAKFSKFIPEEFVATLNVARTQSVKGFKAMVRLLEDIAEFLGKKGEEMYQELRKLLDKVLEWIKKNSKRFEKEIKNSKQIQKQIQKMWDDFSYKDLLEIPPTKKPCFLAGTLVKTESGKVAIENIVTGQRVYAYNANTNEPELRTVTKTYRNRTERYICINTKNGMIEATGLHCFWSLEENKWVPANSLKTGMNLLDAKGQHISITSLEIIESIENTYDLEIEDLHSYYVGTDEVLTHNKNRVSIFASTELIDVEFYAILGENRETIYIGQTTQGYDIRYAQHRRDPKKILWRAKMKGVYDLSINGKSGPFKMTPYEAAVIEFYEINRSGGIGKNNKGLYNKQPPIGKKKFEQFKKLGTFNPCRFYV